MIGRSPLREWLHAHKAARNPGSVDAMRDVDRLSAAVIEFRILERELDKVEARTFKGSFYFYGHFHYPPYGVIRDL